MASYYNFIMVNQSQKVFYIDKVVNDDVKEKKLFINATIMAQTVTNTDGSAPKAVVVTINGEEQSYLVADVNSIWGSTPSDEFDFINKLYAPWS